MPGKTFLGNDGMLRSALVPPAGPRARGGTGCAAGECIFVVCSARSFESTPKFRIPTRPLFQHGLATSKSNTSRRFPACACAVLRQATREYLPQ